MKKGDQVWIKAIVLDVSETAGVQLSVGNYGTKVWIAKSKCNPVEPETVVNQSLTSETNSSKNSNSSSDPVNPSHYKQGPAETIDIIEAAIAKAPNNKAAGLHWQVLKYALRCWFKGGVEDLKKARWYLDRLIREEEAK